MEKEANNKSTVAIGFDVYKASVCSCLPDVYKVGQVFVLICPMCTKWDKCL